MTLRLAESGAIQPMHAAPLLERLVIADIGDVTLKPRRASTRSLGRWKRLSALALAAAVALAWRALWAVQP